MNTNLESALTELAIEPGQVPVAVSDITKALNNTRSDLQFAGRGVGRYLKAAGFVRTVRVVGGVHRVCYFINQDLS